MLSTKALIFYLVAEWIHFRLLGIILPTIKLKVYTFLGLVNSALSLGSPVVAGALLMFNFKGTLRKLVPNLALQEEGRGHAKGQ